MHKFKDVNGDEWSLHLDVTVVRQIRSELGVDLHAMDEGTITSLTADDEKLVDVLSVVCQEQIKKRELDAKGFASCLLGDVLDDACDALVNELVFISRRSRSAVVAKAWEKTKAAENLMTEKAMQMLESGVVEEKVNAMLQEMETQLGSL